MLTRKAKLLLSVTVATPLLFAACVDNTLTGVYGDIAGTYTLTVFSDKSPPATFPYGSGTITWTDGTMVLNGLGTFTETDYYTVTSSGGTQQTCSFVSNGTFTYDASTFQLQLSAPQQNNLPARFAVGTLQFDTINYDEQNNDGSFSSYEYKR